MSVDILSRFTHGEANFYGATGANSAGKTQRAFASTLARLARVGIASAVLVTFVLPIATASASAEESRTTRMANAVERIQASVGLERSEARLQAKGETACYFVHTTTSQHGDGTSPHPDIEDRSIPKVFYARVRSCELSEGTYTRNRAAFEQQAHMSLDAPDLDLRKVDRKAAMLDIDLQKPMSREEALALRDSRNALVVEAVDNGTWFKVSNDIDYDGQHLSMGR